MQDGEIANGLLRACCTIIRRASDDHVDATSHNADPRISNPNRGLLGVLGGK
jgi:hypothetical protein